MKAGTHMDRYLLPVPWVPEAAPFPVQQPWPDLLYGYLAGIFTTRQIGTLVSLYPEGPRQPLFPFLVVEYKTGAGPGGGTSRLPPTNAPVAR
jgi:hypothetical protein